MVNCRYFVGQLMFSTTKLGTKLGNETGSLSGFMSSPEAAHWAALGRAIVHLEIMEVKGVLCVELESHKGIALANVDFGYYNETRRSLGCFLLPIGGCPIDWSMSKRLTLSDRTTEEEHKDLAKLSKSCKFF